MSERKGWLRLATKEPFLLCAVQSIDGLGEMAVRALATQAVREFHADGATDLRQWVTERRRSPGLNLSQEISLMDLQDHQVLALLAVCFNALGRRAPAETLAVIAAYEFGAHTERLAQTKLHSKEIQPLIENLDNLKDQRKRAGKARAAKAEISKDYETEMENLAKMLKLYDQLRNDPDNWDEHNLIPEIAKQMGVTYNTVKSKLAPFIPARRTRKKLQPAR